MSNNLDIILTFSKRYFSFLVALAFFVSLFGGVGLLIQKVYAVADTCTWTGATNGN